MIEMHVVRSPLAVFPGYGGLSRHDQVIVRNQVRGSDISRPRDVIELLDAFFK